MSKPKKESFFWTSYSDLMTSLFFVMLVLFVLTIALLHRRMVATQAQLDKIQEIEKAVNQIDSTYFEYNKTYKKHILKIDVKFPTGLSDIGDIVYQTRIKFKEAGNAINRSIREISREHPEIQYLLVIEGQASNDGFLGNDELSYNRALALRRFWEESGVDFGKSCEVLIAGSGAKGLMRDPVEWKNQRFLIHIIPKPGIIDRK
ncbi:MAG: hypothetical protein LBT70_03295 [Holosporaceae bacterium]|jgi:outer membrane protein OmpA-like peptidoglycan-associated protein|nr:hypothetical protein [Holosporaceae bacterium]